MASESKMGSVPVSVEQDAASALGPGGASFTGETEGALGRENRRATRTPRPSSGLSMADAAASEGRGVGRRWLRERTIRHAEVGLPASQAQSTVKRDQAHGG